MNPTPPADAPATPSQGGPTHEPASGAVDASTPDANAIVTPHGGVGGHVAPGPDATGPVSNRGPGDAETRSEHGTRKAVEGGGYGFDPKR